MASRFLWKPAAIWTLVGIACGSAAWWLLGSGVVPLLEGETLAESLDMMFTAGLLWVGVFGLTTAIIAAPFFFGAFLVWFALAERYPMLETKRGVLLGSIGLAVPFALLIAHFFGGVGSVGTPDYRMAFRGVVVFAFLSGWAGVLGPRWIVSHLRPGKVELRG